MHKLYPSEIITDHASKHTCRHTVNAAGETVTGDKMADTGNGVGVCVWKLTNSRSDFEVITRNRK